jgi:iron-sulfur cluster repair protein YtfE (RIC family)
MTKIAGKKYTKAEIETLLQALQRQTRRARKMAEAAIEQITQSSFETYHDYREALTELEGVIVLIEDRMEHAMPDARAQLKDYHTRLIVDLLRMKIDVVLRVFPALETTEVLPMGTQKVFLSTIWELNETVQRIDREHIEGILDGDARKRLTVAETILREVSERAPSLMELAQQEAKTA